MINGKDIKVSGIIGLLAGALLLPVLSNVGISLIARNIVLAIAGMGALTSIGYVFASFISRWIPVVLQFAKFAIVGGFNALLDLGVLNLLIFLTGVVSGGWYSVFKAVSFLTAVNSSFWMNKLWTFGANQSKGKGDMIKYLIVYSIGFGINVATASFLVNFIGAPEGISLKIWANIGGITASFVGMFWNFVGAKFIVFKR
ncbi:MAG: GtrA family protein [Candidatus Pacebacteria bacterium]|nr:GtrA family protein [Candidatus Paceibacterota bacterium]